MHDTVRWEEFYFLYRFVIYHSATVEFVFAPEERDVYSYERTPKYLAPLGAKSGSGTIGRGQRRVRSYGASE